MKRFRTVATSVALAAVAFVVTSAGLATAGNQWSCWHWDKSTIGVQNAAGGYWGGVIGTEFNEWDAGTCVTFTGGNEIIGDAGFYGNTGWLGIARILQTGPGCTIVQADALMNQSYLDAGAYGATADQHVTCQEIGHTLGLDHRKGKKAKTCMNDQVLNQPNFDSHDADTVAAITTGCDGGGDPPGGDPCAGGNEKGKKKCNDGIDNDGDGCVDGADPDCN